MEKLRVIYCRVLVKSAEVFFFFQGFLIFLKLVRFSIDCQRSILPLQVLDSVRVTAMHLLQLVNNPEWLFQISKGHAYVAHVLDNDKKRIKTLLKEVIFVEFF